VTCVVQRPVLSYVLSYQRLTHVNGGILLGIRVHSDVLISGVQTSATGITEARDVVAQAVGDVGGLGVAAVLRVADQVVLRPKLAPTFKICTAVLGENRAGLALATSLRFMLRCLSRNMSSSQVHRLLLASGGSLTGMSAF